MCNACGFLCCDSVALSGCGCECECPECWAICDECGQYEGDCSCHLEDDWIDDVISEE